MSSERFSIDTLLRTACEATASDLHLKVGNYPYIRVDGELRPLTQYPRLSPEDILDYAFSIMSSRQKAKFKENTEVDMPYGIPGLARFRVNIFQQRGNVGMVFRVIPTNIRDFRGTFPSQGDGEDLRGNAGPGAGGRHHQLRQVHHPGGYGRLHQLHAHRPHHHHRRPHRVLASR